MSTNRAAQYTAFEEVENPGKKTRIWDMRSKTGFMTGSIRWWGAWRKYVFFPEPDCLFDKDCLRLIADFCEEQTRYHMQRLKP